METKEQLRQELFSIEQWEKEQSGLWIWDRIARLPFKLLDKATPKIIQRKMSKLLDEVGYYIQSGGKYLSSERAILRKVEAFSHQPVHTIADVQRVPLAAMDETARSIQRTHVNAATVQGASTGVGGVFMLAADIPAVLAISLKTVQEIAVSYGYDPNERLERVFIIKCLQFVSSDLVGKQAILNEITDFANRDNRHELVSQMQGWREVMLAYREQYSLKKMFRLIPIAGILFGALSNRSTLDELSEAAIMLYRKRRILEKMQQLEQGSVV